MSSPVPVTRQRSWTRIRNYSTERAFRELVRQHNLSHVPTILVKQFAQLGVRSAQYNRKIHELEKEAENGDGSMDAETWARWTFLVTEHRRCTLAIATLSKSIFGDQHRPAEMDLVAQLAQEVSDAETVEPVQPPESESES